MPAPDRQLDAGGGTNTAQTARILAALEPVLAELSPSWCSSTATPTRRSPARWRPRRRGIPVGHVEAGMRSFDRAMPEELNRVLTDHASDLLLCSTETAVRQPRARGRGGESHLVGDVMADVSLAFRDIARGALADPDELGVEPGGYLVVTAHRAGNVDDPERLERLVELLEALPEPVVFPVHPRTRARLEAAGLLDRLERRCTVVAAARLPRLPQAGPPRPCRAHRLRRRPEGGLPARAFHA